MKRSETILAHLGSPMDGKDNFAHNIIEDEEAASRVKSQDLLNPEPDKPKWYRRYLGIFLTIMSSIVFSLGTIVVKKLQTYHAFNLTLFRFQGVLIPSLCVICYHFVTGNKRVFSAAIPGKSNVHFKRNIIMLILRGAISFGSLTLQVCSLQHLDVGDSTVIIMSAPIVVAFLAHLILKEDLGIIPVLVSITSLCGVIIIARPPIFGESYDFSKLIGIGFALASMALGSLIFIVLRFLKEIPACLVTSVFGMLGCVMALVLAFSFGVFSLPRTPLDWGLAFALGVLTFLGQTLFTLALSYEQAGPVAVIRSFDVVFALFWQYIFLGVQPDLYSFIGTLIIFGGVVVVGLRKTIDTLPDDHPRRITFRYLLK